MRVSLSEDSSEMQLLPKRILSVADGFWNRLQKLSAEREDAAGRVQSVARRVRPALTVVTIGYFLLLIVVLGVVRWRGESNWFFSAVLFLPAAFWLLPLVGLMPVQLLVRPRLCVATFVAWVLVGFIYLDFCWSFSEEGNEPGLTVLTNNIGQRQFRALAPFLLKERPDVIALQEIWSGGVRDLRKEFPDQFVSIVGECALVSRYPVRKSEYIRPFGARFEFDYKGQRVAIYQVHMPSPRSEFKKLRGARFDPGADRRRRILFKTGAGILWQICGAKSKDVARHNCHFAKGDSSISRCR